MADKNKARVFHFDLHGKREEKYDFLNNQSIESIQWTELEDKEPYFFFVPKDFESIEEYNLGFSINESFFNYNSGIQTKSDDISIHYDISTLGKVVLDFKELSVSEIKSKYNYKKDTSGWNFESAKKSICEGFSLTQINYRPFDERFTAFTKSSGGFIGRPREVTMKHIIDKNNISLITCRQQSSYDFQHIFITNRITDLNSISLQTKEQSYQFPLYIYPENNSQSLLNKPTQRTPNFNSEIVQKLAELLNLSFTSEKEETEGSFAPIDLLDYIYAVLHSPAYRAKYKEFLKIDFPRVPYPKDTETFWELVKLGGELRQIHLLESPVVEKFITTYPIDGSNQVIKITYEDNKVWINDQQYFDNVPPVAWNFYIGGYQPAQKWLKDRKGRTLSFDDIMHYQKIIVALSETDRIMKEIDGVGLENT
jgi:predicted helicase